MNSKWGAAQLEGEFMQVELAFLRRLLASSAAARDHQEVLTAVIDQTWEATGSDVCSLYLWDSDAGELVLTATNGLIQEGVGRVRLRLGEGVTGLVAAQRRPLSVPDVRLEPRFQWIPGIDEQRFLSMLSVPVVAGDRLVGVLNVQSEEARPHGPDEIDLLLAIGGHVAGIVERSALLDEISLLHQHRTELLVMLAHDIGTPLRIVRSHLNEIASRAAPELRRPAMEAAEELDRMDAQCDRMLRALALGSAELPVRPRLVDPAQLLRQVARRLRAVARGRVHTHAPRTVARVNCDPEAVEEALLNLADNALKYSPPGERINLELRVLMNRIALEVHDRGPGEPAEGWPEPEQPLKPGAKGTPGSGLGLQVVRRIAERHGGSLVIRPGRRGGSVFGIELPTEVIS
jgi:signal transduction histidine kinase